MFGKDKQILSFSMTIHDLSGSGLSARSKYTCSWSRGKKDFNKGETKEATPAHDGVAWNHAATIKTEMVKTSSGYSEKKVDFIVEEHKADKEKAVVGKAQFNLATIANAGPEASEQTIPLVANEPDKSYSLRVTFSLQDAAAASHTDLASEISDVKSDAPAPTPKEKKGGGKNAKTDDAGPKGEAATPPDSGSTSARKRASVKSSTPQGDKRNETTPLSITIIGLAGEGLKSVKGRSIRVEYRYEKELQRHTDFVVCETQKLAWHHWMYLPALAKGSTGKIKFILEMGNEINAKELSSFAVDVATLPGKKEVSFSIKFPQGDVKLYLGIEPYKGVAPLEAVKIVEEKKQLVTENTELKKRLMDLESVSAFSASVYSASVYDPEEDNREWEEVGEHNHNQPQAIMPPTLSEPVPAPEKKGRLGAKGRGVPPPNAGDVATEKKEDKPKPGTRRKQRGMCEDLCVIS